MLKPAQKQKPLRYERRIAVPMGVPRFWGAGVGDV